MVRQVLIETRRLVHYSKQISESLGNKKKKRDRVYKTANKDPKHWKKPRNRLEKAGMKAGKVGANRKGARVNIREGRSHDKNIQSHQETKTMSGANWEHPISLQLYPSLICILSLRLSPSH